MKEKKLWGWFDTRPLIWFHYLLLAIALFPLHELSMLLGLEAPEMTLFLVIYYVIGLGVTDQIIHYVLGVD